MSEIQPIKSSRSKIRIPQSFLLIISREVMLFVGYFVALGQSRESIHLSKIARGMIVKYMKRIFVG